MTILAAGVDRRAITHVSAAGFKSIADETSVELGLISIFAGANSSGKSSLLQPLLLMKQTVEASFDPGPLKLDGPNVEFSAPDQLFSFGVGKPAATALSCGLKFPDGEGVRFEYRADGLRMELRSVDHTLPGGAPLEVGPHHDLNGLRERLQRERSLPNLRSATLRQDRCFLFVDVETHERKWTESLGQERVARVLRQLIHVPGVRGSRHRYYPGSEVRGAMPGVFNDYAASLISRWTEEKDQRLQDLSSALQTLELGWKVQGQRRDASTVEVFVSRTVTALRGGAHDLVNVADTGFAVSQSLPVLVALITAEPGQVVYVEQPEVHLHPRAQVGMARLLVEAARRGVQVVVETHSELLLTALRRLVADEEIAPDAFRLHWFSRDEQGQTRVESAMLDRAGAFGTWPVDFADVQLDEDARYNEAAFKAISAGAP